MNNDRDLELNDVETSGATVIDTGSDLDDGQNKCEKCGSTEISINPNNGNLRCHFCRHEQAATKAEKFVTDISQLEGEVIGSGAGDIVADVADQLTFKCSSCASEVVIDTSEAQQARCHWCRNTLSVNQQIPNGAVPDKVLPFSVKREDAVAAIEKFVGGRKVFAHKTFKAEFTTENVMGVYLPYMVIDVNSHASFDGEASHVVKTYTEVRGNVERTLEDVDTYRIERDFDLIVEDLTVEANTEKLKYKSSQRTNNIVNAIQPFDTDNSVTWDANYMTGFTSQKRDVNANELSGLVQEKATDIATDVVMKETMTSKSRGVKWSRKDMTFKGKQWRSAYLPVWIYSYQQEKSKDKNQIHYVAVNGRTQKAMGSVPLDITSLIIASAVIAVGLAFLTFLFFDVVVAISVAVVVGGLFFAVMHGRYRNAGASHDYVRETTRNMNNLVSNDTLVRQDRGVLVSERVIDNNDSRNSNRRSGVAAGTTVAGASQAERNNRSTQEVRTKAEVKSGASRSSESASTGRATTTATRGATQNTQNTPKTSSSSSRANSSSKSAPKASSSTSRSTPSSSSGSRSSSSSKSASRSSSSASRSTSGSSRNTSTRSSSSSTRGRNK